MPDRLCIVVRGTTHQGKALNEGDTVTLDEDTFRKLSMTNDVIEKMPEPQSEKAPESPSLFNPKKKTA